MLQRFFALLASQALELAFSIERRPLRNVEDIRLARWLGAKR